MDGLLGERDEFGRLTGKPKPWVSTTEQLLSFIPGYGQLAGVALGTFALAYLNHRRGKTSVALVSGIEAFRKELRKSPEGMILDEKFLLLLKRVQENEGVKRDIEKLVYSHTDYTRDPGLN